MAFSSCASKYRCIMYTQSHDFHLGSCVPHIIPKQRISSQFQTDEVCRRVLLTFYKAENLRESSSALKIAKNRSDTCDARSISSYSCPPHTPN
ncbi:hypothetical protein J6590_065621 [Homalodisca vitripennis]|nr:hypothetical protein J6590_065621 [Homalodisca vitripennis]